MLIVNADDFGASRGINRGIVEAHVSGVVTSASLMVTGPATADAVAMTCAHTSLGLGLHLDLDGVQADPRLDLGDARVVRWEMARQLNRFQELTGRAPTHLDTHHHIHRRPEIRRIARDLASQIGVPLRGEGPVKFVGVFYGQPRADKTDLHHVSPQFLICVLRGEVGEGASEIGCHPGYVSDDLVSTYRYERETELRTLKDPSVREAIYRLGITLASYRDLAVAAPAGFR